MATRERSGQVAAPGMGGLDTLYRGYARWLKTALTRRFGTTPHDADDVVQETWLRLSRYAPHDATRFPRALVMRIAANLLRDDARQRRRRGEPVPLDRIGDTGAPACAPEQFTALVLKETILSLPPVCRDVFVLSRFSTMTYEEIAEHLGISVKTVEWRMAKALAHCTAQLGDQGTHERQ